MLLQAIRTQIKVTCRAFRCLLFPTNLTKIRIIIFLVDLRGLVLSKWSLECAPMGRKVDADLASSP